MEAKEKREVEEPAAVEEGKPIPVLQRPALKIDRQRQELYARLDEARKEIRSIG